MCSNRLISNIQQPCSRSSSLPGIWSELSPPIRVWYLQAVHSTPFSLFVVENLRSTIVLWNVHWEGGKVIASPREGRLVPALSRPNHILDNWPVVLPTLPVSAIALRYRLSGTVSSPFASKCSATCGANFLRFLPIDHRFSRTHASSLSLSV